MPHPAELRRVWLSTGVTVTYVEQGDRTGTDVVLLHAWGESLLSFDRLLPRLPRTLHAVAVDQRGHGGSDKPPSGYSLLDMARDVEAFLDAVGVPAAVIVGSSSGGYVAQQVAVTVPDRVAGLVLLGSPRTLRERPPFADEVDQLTDPVDREWVTQSLTWFPLSHDVPAWYLDARVDDGTRIPAAVWQQTLAGLTAAVPPTEAGRIDTPTLIIWGADDDLLPRADQDRLAAAIPKSSLQVYGATGHLVLWEQPERVAADIASFVAGLAANGAR